MRGLLRPVSKIILNAGFTGQLVFLLSARFYLILMSEHILTAYIDVYGLVEDIKLFM